MAPYLERQLQDQRDWGRSVERLTRHLQEREWSDQRDWDRSQERLPYYRRTPYGASWWME